MSTKDQDLYSQTQSYYESHAAELFQSYGSVESPLSETINAQFRKGERLLDIGCGSGRDLKALHDSGYEAYGLDGSREFIRLAKEKYPELGERFHHGTIPDEFPSSLNTEDWDGIICSAVLQHIPDNLISGCFFGFQRLLKPGGRLVISVPVDYPVQDDQDAKGRLFKIRPVEKYDHLLRRIRFTPLHKEESSDSLNRSGITWVKLVYRKESQGV